jgi:hypothetical protein
VDSDDFFFLFIYIIIKGVDRDVELLSRGRHSTSLLLPNWLLFSSQRAYKLLVPFGRYFTIRLLCG